MGAIFFSISHSSCNIWKLYEVRNRGKRPTVLTIIGFITFYTELLYAIWRARGKFQNRCVVVFALCVILYSNNHQHTNDSKNERRIARVQMSN